MALEGYIITNLFSFHFRFQLQNRCSFGTHDEFEVRCYIGDQQRINQSYPKKEDLLDYHKDKPRGWRAHRIDRGTSKGKFENNILFLFRSSQQFNTSTCVCSRKFYINILFITLFSY